MELYLEAEDSLRAGAAQVEATPSLRPCSGAHSTCIPLAVGNFLRWARAGIAHDSLPERSVHDVQQDGTRTGATLQPDNMYAHFPTLTIHLCEAREERNQSTLRAPG